MPEEILKPVRYTKKQLQQIYYEVLGENLTFEELNYWIKEAFIDFDNVEIEIKRAKRNYTDFGERFVRKLSICK